jgi:hypothetical protein
MTIAMPMFLAAAAMGDVIEIRGQDTVFTGEIAALSPAGVTLKVGEGVPTKVISWDQVRAIKANKLPAPGAVIFAPLSERLMRARLRMERRDLSKAEEVVEPLYAEHSASGTLAGPTGALLAECTLRVRLYHGGGTNAVTPWLDWLACRAATQDENQKQDWFGGATRLPVITDRASGLCPDVPPIFGGLTNPAAIRTLMQRADWARLLSVQSPVRGMASAYAAAVLFESGEPFALPAIDAATSDGERLVLEIVTSRVGGDNEREPARARIRKRLEQLDRVDDSRESTDPASVPDDRTWQRPWLHAALGRSLLREADPGQRRLGLVELLHVPALYARTQPRLAALCLFDALAELRQRGEKPEAINAIERELRNQFQIDIDTPDKSIEPAPVKRDEGPDGGGGGVNP